VAGPLPASLADLVDVVRFDVQGNTITGGALPAMNFGQTFCYLLDYVPVHPIHNTFRCPWPQGAVAKCRREDSRGNWDPITEADCTAQLYKCVNNACVAGDTGVPQAGGVRPRAAAAARLVPHYGARVNLLI